VFDLTRIRNLKKTHFCVFCRVFDFLRFCRAGVARTSRGRRAKRRANAISSFRRCFVSHDQCCREPQISFEVSLKGCLRNFLWVFFFYTIFVRRSNGLAKAVAHMIRLTFQSPLISHLPSPTYHFHLSFPPIISTYHSHLLFLSIISTYHFHLSFPPIILIYHFYLSSLIIPHHSLIDFPH
jgi:hypothetical protein